MKSIADTLLILGATMRLTRLITNDDLGQWWVKDPIDALFHPTTRVIVASPVPDDEEPRTLTVNRAARLTKGHKYLAGLSCPWCIGTWVGYGVLATTVLTKGTRLEKPWRFVMAGLTLNTVTVSLGDKLGHWE